MLSTASVWADPIKWEPAPLELPVSLYLTNEGSQETTRPSVNSTVENHPKTYDLQTNPWELLPFVNFQPCTKSNDSESPQDSARKNEQIEIQRKANTLSEEANYLQSRYVFLTFWLVVIGAFVGGMQIRLMFSQNRISTAIFRRDRPYLLITTVEPSHFDTKFVNYEEWQKNAFMVSVTCMVENFGKAPVIIKEIVACLKPSSPPLSEPPDFSACFPIPRSAITREIISGGDASRFRVNLSGPQAVITDEMRDTLKDIHSSMRVDLRGIIRYEDPTGDKFETRFGYLYACVRLEDTADFRWVFVRGPDGYNKRT